MEQQVQWGDDQWAAIVGAQQRDLVVLRMQLAEANRIIASLQPPADKAVKLEAVT